jgi:hypothetical protein
MLFKSPYFNLVWIIIIIGLSAGESIGLLKIPVEGSKTTTSLSSPVNLPSPKS